MWIQFKSTFLNNYICLAFNVFIEKTLKSYQMKKNVDSKMHIFSCVIFMIHQITNIF